MDARYAERSPAAASPGAIPPELLPEFSDRFIGSHRLIEQYVSCLAFAVFRELGLDELCRDGLTIEDALARAHLLPAVALVPLQWIFATLARQGWLRREGSGTAERFSTVAAAEVADPDSVLDLQRRLDPHALPAFSIAQLAARHYPAVLRGERTGEEVLFAADNMGAWMDYFSNANPLYAINNTVGAHAALRALPARPGTILELGGGLGSGAEALLRQAERAARRDDIAAYKFTEVVPTFLRRARGLLAERFAGWPLTYHFLDMNAGFPESVAAAGSVALVYGVNVLHVAHDLSATLQSIRRVLQPGGALAIAECMRPFEHTPLYVEFVFNLLESFRTPLRVPGWRPNGGFLTPEQWRAALQANGFSDIVFYPDLFSIRETHPSFYVGAVMATSR